MRVRVRGIGPIGTAARLLVAAGLLYLALLRGTSWRLGWYGALFGLVVLPAVMLVLGLAARHYSRRPVNFTGSCGTLLNCAAIVALLANHRTQAGTELFYSATLLAAAWRGQPGCEATVISNWILRREDQLGCPIFSPIDRIETCLNPRNKEHRSGMNPRRT